MNNITIAATLVLSMGLGVPAAVLAQDDGCVLHYVRTACQGQEATSFSKCDGQAECDQTNPADSVEGCATAALEACANSRLDITKYKVVTAKFAGQDLKGGFDTEGNADPVGLNFCNKDRPDLNQCD